MNFSAFFWFPFLLLVFCGHVVLAQGDSAAVSRGAEQAGSAAVQQRLQDPAAWERWQLRREAERKTRDSIKAIGDSLAMVWLKPPDPSRTNRFRDSLIQAHLVKDLDFREWAGRFPKASSYDMGMLRPRGEPWVLAFIVLLLVLFAILRNTFFKQLTAIVLAFFSNRVLGQINKEENFFNSWPFVFLYLLFGFTIGMLLYQFGRYFQLSYAYSGFNWFLRLSLLVIGLYTLKIFLVRLLGFLFDASRMAREYIAILYLSYFNAALLFLPIVFALSLSPGRFAAYYINLSLIVLGAISFFQFFRAITNILSGYRFPKVYLIVYLCALEISPLLILMKALRF